MRNKYVKGLAKLVRTVIRNRRDGGEARGYASDFDIHGISEHALSVAEDIRKADREPAIILHGVTTRSGTNFIANLLRLHPDVCLYPKKVTEVPFLGALSNLIDFQVDFFNSHSQNRDRIEQNDFLPLFGSAFIDYFYSLVPQGKRLFLKVPNVRYLNYFFSVFPYENLLLLMRDGRDVVSSMIKTWPDKDFSDACREWERNARMCLDFHAKYSGQAHRYMFVKYEDVVAHPSEFVMNLCTNLSLDHHNYPFEKIPEIKVVGSSAIQPQGRATWKPIEKPSDFKPVGR